MPLLKLTIIGNAGTVAEVRTTSSGIKQAHLSVAVNSKQKDRTTGEMTQTTEWWRLIFFDKLAGIAEQFIQKGSTIYAEGRPRIRTWTDRNNETRVEQEIIVDQMQLVGSRPQEAVRSSAEAMAPKTPRAPAAPAAEKPEFDDDVPF